VIALFGNANAIAELLQSYSVMLGYYNKNAHSSIDSDMLQAKDGT
jgi:hypothetical protein